MTITITKPIVIVSDNFNSCGHKYALKIGAFTDVEFPSGLTKPDKLLDPKELCTLHLIPKMMIGSKIGRFTENYKSYNYCFIYFKSIRSNNANFIYKVFKINPLISLDKFYYHYGFCLLYLYQPKLTIRVFIFYFLFFL